MRKQVEADTLILGGGLAGLCLAHFLKQDTTLVEKHDVLGGLMRSYSIGEITYDIGPHIIFSKNEWAVEFLSSLTKCDRIRRSNMIFYKGGYVKYPFENHLSMLPDEDKRQCLDGFLENSHQDENADNMLAFFLKTFGEGITRKYLEPYNRKIWKYPPEDMDTQMVERIPKPPKEDIIKSASGQPREGYLHQLHFHYPLKGGIQSLTDSLRQKIKGKACVYTGSEVTKVRREGSKWVVEAGENTFHSRKIINCMPLNVLFRVLEDVPDDIKATVDKLRYNSIHVVLVGVKKDKVGDNFSILIPQQDVIFHRLSKLAFLGKAYRRRGSDLICEITYRRGDIYSRMNRKQIREKVVEGLERLGLVEPEDVEYVDLKSEEYAYVIYDLNHKKTSKKLLKWLEEKGIRCCGRFAEYKYLNMDGVAEHAKKLAEELNHGRRG